MSIDVEVGDWTNSFKAKKKREKKSLLYRNGLADEEPVEEHSAFLREAIPPEPEPIPEISGNESGMLQLATASILPNSQQMVSDPLIGSRDASACTSQHKKLFVCCLICSRTILITVDPGTPFELMEELDSSNLCGLIFTTCRLESKTDAKHDGWGKVKNTNRTLVSKQIILESRLHRICETVAGGPVEIFSEDKLIMYKPVDKIDQSLGPECTIRSINVEPQSSNEGKNLALPFLQGKFL